MSRFPKLKSGAAAQYPASKTIAYSTWTGQFVGGGEQRFREQPAPLRRWVIDLRLLTEGEVTNLREFFEEAQGRFGEFEFEDPWDSTVYSPCSFDSDESSIQWDGEDMGRTRIMIRQNRT